MGVEVQTEAHVPSAPSHVLPTPPAGVGSSAWVEAERSAAAAAVLEAVRTLTVLCAADAALPPCCLAPLARLQVRTREAPLGLSVPSRYAGCGGASSRAYYRVRVRVRVRVGQEGGWPRHSRERLVVRWPPV